MRPLLTLLFTLIIYYSVEAQTIKPVTPDASPEAVALLQYIYSLKGEYTLTGQHNYPLAHARNSDFAAKYIGKRPVIWSMDFGFSKDGDQDLFKARQANVEEAKRQHELGSLITFCWHAVPPTADEPVTFQPLPGADPDHLASVQGRLTEQQYKDVLTKGSTLNRHWMAQVDTIAFYLKELMDAHIPVLWRPYHEMNGDWFWWGNRSGKYSTADLYRQLFDHLVNYHKLNNLIWVWSVDRPSRPGMEFANFYPGDKYLDILALDVYGSDFNQDYYNGLLALSKGKPITLAEVGNPPSLDILQKQPKWCYWVVWATMTHLTSQSEYDNYIKSSEVLFMDDEAYENGIRAYRKICGLPPIHIDHTANFTGTWFLDKEKSAIAEGFNNPSSQMKVDETAEQLTIERTVESEWEDAKTAEQILPLDGSEAKSEGPFGAPQMTTAKRSEDGTALLIHQSVTFNRGGQSREFTTDEEWTTDIHGELLTIHQTSKTFRGEQTSTLVYRRL